MNRRREGRGLGPGLRGAALALGDGMPPLKLVTVARTCTVVFAIMLGGCGSAPLGEGGAAAAAAGASGGGGAGPSGQGGGTASGQAGAGGASGGGGSPGSVTLRLNLPSSTSFCDMTCGGVTPHITIFTTDKQQVPTEIPFCSQMCADGCQPVGCPVGGACFLTGVMVTQAELHWDGSSYPTSTCGAGASCYQPTFVPPGQYVAHMCATPGTVSQSAGNPPVCVATGGLECVDVTFDLPGKNVVEGSLSDGNQVCGAIHAADYDQSCADDSDCVVETEGDFCQADVPTACNTAINVNAEKQYEADFVSRFSKPSGFACPPRVFAYCGAGMCRVGEVL
jgi:hypothetical protein